jgi:predicted ribosomally synthesized peptide with SipW-like signal peptide
MMKLSRKWIVLAALVLSVAMATTGTVAYLSDTASEVNVMTMGSVKIEQIEQERDASGKLVDFTLGKPALPAVGPIEWAAAGKGAIVNDTEYKVFTEELKNVVDKIVTVKNNEWLVTDKAACSAYCMAKTLGFLLS